MATRRPLIHKDGYDWEMPVGDTLPADVIPASATLDPDIEAYIFFLAES